MSGCLMSCVVLLPFTPDDSLDPEDSDQRTHFPQFSYSASIREWSRRLVSKQAGEHTITIPHTHLHCWATAETETGTRHIFIRSLTHVHTDGHTHTRTHIHILAIQTRRGSLSMRWTTELSRFVWIDWQLCLCASSGLASGFPAGPLLHHTGVKALTLWKPGYASKYHLFTSCTHSTHTHTYIYTNPCVDCI